MNYLSTRGDAPPTQLGTALKTGLAPDGGLYVPEHLPVSACTDVPSLPTTAAHVLAPFFAGSTLEHQLDSICQAALDLPLPITELEPGQAWMLELFHGPTAAFKDFAARFLAECMTQLRQHEDKPQTVLVATSGDTGAAVAAAFHNRPGFRVVILYPDGRVAARQAHQLGAFGGNVHTFKVDGSFDDCQRLAKQALNDTDLTEALALTSANSISIGRLLPQISYYAHAACKLASELDQPIDVIVPTGNLGNALACILTRDMGLPIGQVTLATNANRTLPDFFSGADYRGRASIRTLANAMDVGDPSNFERLAWFYRNQNLRESGIRADSIDDDAINTCIRRTWKEKNIAICPHTACALEALQRQRAQANQTPTLIAATAHAAKFDQVVEPLIGQNIEPPPALAELLSTESHAEALKADFDALSAMLRRLE